MILVQEPLIVYQHFEQQEKLSADIDMLHSLLTFHCRLTRQPHLRTYGKKLV